MCLVARSNQRRSDPPPGRRNERMPYNCYDSSVENNDILVYNDDSLVENGRLPATCEVAPLSNKDVLHARNKCVCIQCKRVLADEGEI